MMHCFGRLTRRGWSVNSFFFFFFGGLWFGRGAAAAGGACVREEGRGKREKTRGAVGTDRHRHRHGPLILVMAPVAVGRSVPGTGSWNEWCRDSSVRRVGCVVHAVGLEVAAQRDMDGVFLIVLKKLGQVGWWCFGCVAVWWGDVGWVIGPSVLLRGRYCTYSVQCSQAILCRSARRQRLDLLHMLRHSGHPARANPSVAATQQRKKRDAHQDSHSTAGWTGPGSNQSDEANFL
ncbi:hypothetical protein IWX90DRAFT_272470 [Phyllosticta citrichinensis]|uniref:Secreted protein n=1 Tax=Phyllosticta citrichinensis TaxID=1130410 RepID=A0ABR1XNB7_9PEZI